MFGHGVLVLLPNFCKRTVGIQLLALCRSVLYISIHHHSEYQLRKAFEFFYHKSSQSKPTTPLASAIPHATQRRCL